MMLRRTLIVLALALASLTQAAGGTFYQEELHIPFAAAGPEGLEALLIRPQATGRYPLVLISHGAPRKADNARTMSPRSLVPAATEFARRGWAAVIVMRRGYGQSGGNDVERSRSCTDPDYVASARTSAADLNAAIRALVQRSDIDGSRILAVGHSAGGLATVALTAEPPPGLLAAINFAGGRGSRSDNELCREDRLISAFGLFGKTSRVPMLWVYSENDHYFAPQLAEKFRQAFVDGGGRVDFVKAAPFGADGHNLFSLAGIPVWTPIVNEFLAKQNLTQRPTPMTLDLPALMPPPQLSERGRNAFELYRMAASHKAFAISADGHFGWRTGRRTGDQAKAEALKLCEGDVLRDCRIVFIDDEASP